MFLLVRKIPTDIKFFPDTLEGTTIDEQISLNERDG